MFNYLLINIAFFHYKLLVQKAIIVYNWHGQFVLIPLFSYLIVLTTVILVTILVSWISFKTKSRKMKNRKNTEIPYYQKRNLKYPQLTPSGFTLLHSLQEHTRNIYQIAWSPNGRTIVSTDGNIRVWDVETGQLFMEFGEGVYSLAWSPNGKILAAGSYEDTIQIWDAETWHPIRLLKGNSHYVRNLVWSSDGKILAASSGDNIVQLWLMETWQLLHTFKKGEKIINQEVLHVSMFPTNIPSIVWPPNERKLIMGFNDGLIQLWNIDTVQLLWSFTGNPLSLSSCNSIACSLDGQILASGFSDGTIYLLNSQTGQQIGTLEGHTDQVYSVSFSFDGHLLASQSFDNTIRCWRTDTWEIVAALSETKFSGKESLLHGKTNLAFHPTASILATVSGGSTAHIWDLNLVTLLGSHLNTSPVRYTNAKIVLVGDSGVGKSGLGLVLAKQHFVPTESTHGRHVWVFDKREVETHERRKETREILLWDLAGQPGYRLIHQLHLNEVAIAMIVFDAHSETNPFGGVEYWNRALRLAQRLQSNQGMLLQKFLVAARVDRGGIGVSHSRVDSLIKDLGFNGYFETSAKEDIGIEKLKIAIQETIDWNMLPWVSSTDLFQRIMNFLITEKATGRLLFTIDDLYRVFLQTEKISIEEENLYDQFRTCIGRFESRGLIRKLNFGNFVLLQPELLDSYASSLINAVKDEPDGLGSILEERVLMGDFPIPEDERLADRGQEKVLLIAMIDDLLRYEIILREPSDEGQYLIFPSQSTREHPDLPDPQGKTVVFSFEGPVLGIYTTLAVRLSHSGMFKKQELWKNAVIYTTKVGGTCGIFLQSSDEGQGILSLFFDKITSEETRIYFEEYVETHLRRRAIAESVKRNTIIACKECNTIVEDKVVQLRLVRGFNWLNCPVCDKRVEILPKERPATPLSLVIQLMDRTADTQRERETIQSIIQGKLEIKDFDVYLCHNDQDKSEVKGIGRQLKENGILPWLDEWELRPGLPWQRLLEEQIERIRSVAIFVGKDSTEPWRQMEVEAFLREFVERGCPVIPVILPGTYAKPEFPIFLKGMTWVDFRKQDPDPMEQLIWGISGKRGYNTV